jgi:hypothetical protein
MILAKGDRVQTSCGFGVPLMEHRGARDTLLRWSDSEGAEGLAAYRAEKNHSSIDGLPMPLGVQTPRLQSRVVESSEGST